MQADYKSALLSDEKLFVYFYFAFILLFFCYPVENWDSRQSTDGILKLLRAQGIDSLAYVTSATTLFLLGS
jgi:hypothetical protein